MLTMKQLNLDSYQENRLLLIFAPNSTDAAYQRQIDMFRGRTNAFSHRDLLTFHLFEGEPGYTYNKRITADVAAVTRQRFNVAPGEFVILLVGKDGQIKLRADRPTHPDGILALIDSSTMRRWGIREKIMNQ